ncbi:MAG: VOC family protein [Candidatus Paracaedibacteraceae bacterium]|nr:VOC family protein [Candidatus Paracaedibacteraceae bacterium]
MEQRLSVITLGVESLSKAKQFYTEGLGWKLSPNSQEGFAVFQIGGMLFALYPKQALAEEVNIPVAKGFSGITLAYNVRRKADVDATLSLAQDAGATILKKAEATFWGGYSGYFSDLDGHVFEIAWNPFWPLDEHGNIDVS